MSVIVTIVGTDYSGSSTEYVPPSVCVSVSVCVCVHKK